MIDPEQGTPTRSQKTVLSFNKLVYTVETKQSPCSKPEDKIIVNNVSGIFKPGLNAILGATGSGKTSLLDILAARKDPKGLDGEIMINGNAPPNNYKLMCGYVPQDDIVTGTLTVRENIYFSAKLRLSPKIPDEEKQRMVDEVIEELGLTHVANAKVGNQMIRGISGGERKRTCIGIELVISPRVLFLDEPTTGLDSTTAGSVMNLLHRLSRRGRTIIFSIHQPRYSIFKLFDRMMLLAKGKVMYHGKANEALQYFSDIGYECETHDNPADFILDVINGDINNDNESSTDPSPDLQNGYDNHSYVISENEHVIVPSGDVTQVKFSAQNGHQNGGAAIINNKVLQKQLSSEDEKFDLVAYVNQNSAKYNNSRWHSQLREEFEPILKQYSASKSLSKEETRQRNKDQKVQYSVSFAVQFRHLSQRTFLNLWRNPLASLMQVVITIIFGVIVGLIYFDMDSTKESGIQNRVGAFFFLTMNQIFMNLSALELFLDERLMFMHENATGFYRVSVYFLTKIFFDMIPMRIIPNIGFSVIIYFMTGLRIAAGKFFIFLITLSITSCAAAGFCFMFSALFDIYAVVNLLSALTFVFMMVFGGLIVNVDDIYPWLSWLKYLSIFRYAMNALSITELDGLELCDHFKFENGTSGKENCTSTDGNMYLETQNIEYGSHWDLWQNIFALGMLAVFSLGVTYIRLRTINKYK